MAQRSVLPGMPAASASPRLKCYPAARRPGSASGCHDSRTARAARQATGYRALEDWAFVRGVQARFHSAWKTRRERLIEGLQRTSPRRVLDRPPVRLDRGCAGQDRSVAGRLQSAPSAWLARPPDAERIRPATSGSTYRLSRVFLASAVVFWDQRQYAPTLARLALSDTGPNQRAC
jgi:hypothetical protein